jgi:hypothetical protein
MNNGDLQEQLKELTERLGALESAAEKQGHEIQRLRDVNAIRNLISKEAYLFEAHMHEERLALIAQQTPGVTIEQGLRGVFEGLEGARRTMIDIEKSMERSHAAGMKKAFPEMELSSETAGMLETQLTGTTAIEVAVDGKTARAAWVSLMACGKTHENDPRPQASWVWWKSAADFVKEDGEWKFWHVLKNPLFLASYTKDWVEASLGLPPIPAPGTCRGIPGHEANPDRPNTKLYDSYRITREPKLHPEPPEPYGAFDESDSYSY